MSGPNARPPKGGNFAGYPKSITELRADLEDSGSAWTPRDVLISVLRKIDEGEAVPETLVICWTDTVDMPIGIPSVCWELCSKGITPVLGLLARTAHRINHQYDSD